LDETIRLVENLIPGGENKKLAVMSTMEKILDYIIIQTFPVWAKPFSNMFKNFVLNVLIGNSIDFIVSKYKSGLWKSQENQPAIAKPVETPPTLSEIFIPPIQEVQEIKPVQEVTNVKKRKTQKKISKKN